MKYSFIIIAFALVVVAVIDAEAQTFREKTVLLQPFKADTAYFIGYWVDSGSITFYTPEGFLLEPESFYYNRVKGTVRLNVPTNFKPLYIVAKMRYQPFSVPQFYESETADSILIISKDSVEIEVRSISSIQTVDDLFGDSDIKKSGSLTRGFTIGNNQDLSLESGLRLDLSGNITDDVEIEATLTDQSTPIQPDGTTQNLREFDRVHILLKSPKSRLELGDIDVAVKGTRFAQIARRLQGIEGQTSFMSGVVDASAAVARGKFNSLTFIGEDGKQGPFRLTGSNNEPFVIVLAGTEQVYVNGMKMQRGENNDYIIDYGLGEIFFTNKRIIKRQEIIKIDFQYISSDFSRSVITATAQSDPMFGGKVRLGFNFVRENDNNNRLNQFSLTEDEIRILEEAGDSEGKSVVSGVRFASGDFLENELLYHAVDTTINGEKIRFYTLSDDLNPPLYRIRFSRVENGNYVRIANDRNGIFYQYSGNGNGNYDTLRTLNRPIDHKMVTLQSVYTINEHITFSAEAALSDYDKNAFSNLDNDDNKDLGYDLKLDGQWRTDVGKFSVIAQERFTGRSFRYFERPEDANFTKDWNVEDTYLTEQRLQAIDAEWQPTTVTEMKTGFGRLLRSDVKSQRYYYKTGLREYGWLHLESELNVAENTNTVLNETGNRSNHGHKLSYDVKLNDVFTLTPLITYQGERRMRRSTVKDSLFSTSFRTDAVGSGVNLQKGNDLSLNYTYQIRQDYDVLSNQMVKAFHNQLHTASLLYLNRYIDHKQSISLVNKKAAQKFRDDAGYSDQESVYMDSKTLFKTGSNAINGSFIYTVNTEQRSLLQETYIEVGPEMGEYIWDDLNGDGIKQIDEFFPEQTPNEGIYIKQFIPSDELLPSIDLKTRLQVSLTPFLFIDPSERTQSPYAWSRIFKYNFLADIRENSKTNRLSDVYLLKLNTFLNDSTTLLGRQFMRNELQLFPTTPDYDIRIGTEVGRTFQQQAFGEERIKSFRHTFLSRIKLSDRYQWTSEFLYSGQRKTNSQISNRNYSINGYEVLQKLNSNLSRVVQLGTDLSFSRKRDTYQNRKTQSKIFKAGGDLRSFYKDRLQLFGRIQYQNTSIEGDINPQTNFELSEGAGIGDRWLWSLQVNYRISELLRSNLTYDGRTLTNRSAIHTLRVTVRAIF